jgi:hypothetical protein
VHAALIRATPPHLYSYNNTARAVLTFLDCDRVGAELLLRESPSVSCDSEKYHTLRPLFLVLVGVVVIGLPPMFLALLRCTRTPEGDSKASRTRRERYGILYEMFKPHCWWEKTSGLRDCISTHARHRAGSTSRST